PGNGPLQQAERAHLLGRHQCRSECEVQPERRLDVGIHLLSSRLREAATRLCRHARGTITADMAARQHAAPYGPTEIIDLRRLGARDLEPLLQEESATWREQLEWDFDKSADL